MGTYALGLLELNSIAAGIQTADTIVKAANIRLLFCRPICPGKYMVLFSGTVAEVDSAMAAGIRCGEHDIVDQLVIPHLHPAVVEGLALTGGAAVQPCIGVMEYFSIAAAVLGADAAVKSADVELIEIRLGIGIGGKSYVSLGGNIGSVKEAVENGTRQAKQEGMLLKAVVIPAVSKEIWDHIL